MKKKTYILLALASFIAVTCSKPSPDGPTPIGPESSKSYIFFEAGMLDVSETKAVDLIDLFPSENGTTFGVIGHYDDGQTIFDSYANGIANVYNEGGVFKYDYLASWMGSVHTFHAFYPYDDLKASIETGTDNIPYVNYMQPTSSRNMKDILGAYAQVTASASPTPVALEFQHLLWALNIEIKNSQTRELTTSDPITNPTLTVRKVDLSISGFPQMGSLKLDSGYTVEPSSAKVELNYNLYSNETGEQIPAGQFKTYGPLLFMPVSSLTYRVTVEYTTASGVRDTMTGEFRPVSKTFVRGRKYTLTINKTNDKFFEVEGLEPEDWTSNQFEHTFE